MLPISSHLCPHLQPLKKVWVWKWLFLSKQLQDGPYQQASMTLLWITNPSDSGNAPRWVLARSHAHPLSPNTQAPKHPLKWQLYYIHAFMQQIVSEHWVPGAAQVLRTQRYKERKQNRRPKSCFPVGYNTQLSGAMDCGSPGSSVHGILQARILEWIMMPSSRGSSWPRDRTHVSCISCIGRWALYH